MQQGKGVDGENQNMRPISDSTAPLLLEGDPTEEIPLTSSDIYRDLLTRATAKADQAMEMAKQAKEEAIIARTETKKVKEELDEV